MSGLHRVEGGLVEAVISATLASEVQLGVLLPLPLLNRALHRQRELHTHTLHVSLDLVQVLLAEVLHGVAHGEGLEHGHPVLGDVVDALGQVAAVGGADGGDVVGPPAEALSIRCPQMFKEKLKIDF